MVNSSNGNQDDHIPVIDLNDPEAARLLFEASCRHGFIFVRHVNLHLSPLDVDRMFRVSKELFAAPLEEKAFCSVNSNKSGKNHGWLAMNAETLDPAHQKKGDSKEAFNIAEYAHGKPQQAFPISLQPYESELGTFIDKCHSLCNDILRLLAKGLQIQEDSGGSEWFSVRHDKNQGPTGSVLRLLYYPIPPKDLDQNPTEDMRAGAHSDYGSVTLLFRLPGQPGLEILTASRTWKPVPTSPDNVDASEPLPILVNLGDLLSYWTNGLLKSTVHRVVFPKADELSRAKRDRYSIAYFCHPQDDAKLTAIPSSLISKSTSAENGDKVGDGKILTARDHLETRLAATYSV